MDKELAFRTRVLVPYDGVYVEGWYVGKTTWGELEIQLYTGDLGYWSSICVIPLPWSATREQVEALRSIL